MKGIYKITNLKNNKVYIGQTIRDVNIRIEEHKKALNKNTHINKHLQSAWNKYGEENFKFDIVEIYKDISEDKLTEREQFWIDYYGGLNSDNNYNNRDASNKGHLSEQTKQLLSKKHKGKTVIITESTKKKISTAMKGRPAHNKGTHVSEEVKNKISKKLKGKKKPPRTPETCIKLSIANKGKVAWNKGKTMSYKGIKWNKELINSARHNRAKLQGYIVYQYDLNKNLIGSYESTMEAERQTGITNAGISACCRGLQKTSHEFIWSKIPLT